MRTWLNSHFARIVPTRTEQVAGVGWGREGSWLAGGWGHEDEDAGSWTRKAPLPAELGGDQGVNLEQGWGASGMQPYRALRFWSGPAKASGLS